MPTILGQIQSPAVTLRGRYRHKPTSLHCIYRIDNSTNSTVNTTSWGQGWQLHKNFRYYRYRPFFSDKRYGGRGKALKAAQIEREFLDTYRVLIVNKLEVLKVKHPKMTRTEEGKRKLVKWAVREIGRVKGFDSRQVLE